MARAGESADEFPRPLGRYVLTGLLGRGAMGEVYRAHDPVIDRQVAIKLMRAELLDPDARADFIERFRLEVRAAGRCSHPGIVSVYDFSDDPVAPYIVMELVEGLTLQQRLRGAAPLAPAEAVGFGLQILDALAYAHGLGIVHRDIKPANVVATGGGRLKLMDFGIARMSSRGLTQVGTMIGTLRYMAPEQAAGRTVDQRADLFSVALMLCEMLSGDVPVPGSTAAEILLNLTGPAPLDLSKVELRAPDLVSVLGRALAKDPAQRFQSAANFAEALRTSSAEDLADEERTVVRAPRTASLGHSPLDPAVLASAEKSLATVVGPISRLLVQKAASAAMNSGEFIAELARGIPDEADRARFIGSTRVEKTAPTRPATVPGVMAVRDEALGAAQRLLAFYMGPVARILVRQAAAGAGSPEAFREALAAHLSRPDQQTEFRRRFGVEVLPSFKG